MKRSTLNCIIFLAWAFPTIGLAERILAYLPFPAISHHFFYEPILRGLAERGHRIDYFSPFPPKVAHDNITYIPLGDSLDKIFENQKYDKRTSVIQCFSSMLQFESWYAQNLCKNEPTRDLINSNATYDLLLHESMYMMKTSEVLKHKFNVPSVMLAAFDDFLQLNEFSGLLINPSYMVSMLTDYTDHMDFFERLHNSYILTMSLFLEYIHLKQLQRHVDECYKYSGWESRPPLTELLANQSLILVNNHPSVGFPFPRPPHVKEIGGAAIKAKKPLPQDLVDFIDEAKDGVIYLSLGSIFDWEKIEPAVKGVFYRVFSARKEKILWKMPLGAGKGLPSNVRISRWFPQNDVLAHPNVKLFITHGGLQSFFEAVHHSVPLVVVPLFVDQFKNALAIDQHGYGVRLLWDNITEDSLTWALNEVLYQPKYKDQARKGSALFNDRMTDPVEEAVYWIEYVLRHGNVLQPVGSRLDFIQRHCLDVILFIFAFIFAIIYSSFYLIKYHCHRCGSLIKRNKNENWFSEAKTRKNE